MYDIIELGKKIIASIGARDVESGLRQSGEMLGKLADIYVAAKNLLSFDGSPEQKAALASMSDDLGKAVAEAEGKKAFGGILDNLDFLKVLAVVKAIRDLIASLRK